MQKKTIYILISISLIVILSGLLYYYLVNNRNSGSDGPIATIRNFIPFGGGGNTNINENNEFPIQEENVFPTEENNEFTNKLRKISDEQVSGYGLSDVKAGTILRYIEKATGHVYEVELFSPRIGRISNTTMPRVYDAFWGNKNNTIIARYLKDDDETIETFSLTIKETSTTTENIINGIALPNNIRDISVLDTNMFYLEEGSGFSSGYISNLTGGNRKQIWNSPIREVVSQYINSGTIALTTKPHESVYGYLYFVNTNNGTIRKILGDIYGLTTLVNDNLSKILYLNQNRGNYGLYVYNSSTKESSLINPTTFPEKCVWSKKDRNIAYCGVPKEFLDETSLTNWYRGSISTNDDVWKVDTNNNSVIVSNLSNDAGLDIDIIKPQLSSNEQYFVFINKKDNTLWSLDLTK